MAESTNASSYLYETFLLQDVEIFQQHPGESCLQNPLLFFTTTFDTGAALTFAFAQY